MLQNKLANNYIQILSIKESYNETLIYCATYDILKYYSDFMTTATFPCGSILREAILLHNANYLLFSLCYLWIGYMNELII